MSDPIHDIPSGFARLQEIMRRLRDPRSGCPWDVAQDFATIAPYTIEESYEVADAIAREAWDELPGELGDLLFQTFFHSQIAEDKGMFTIEDVVQTISQKMIDRHPHVFGTQSRQKSAEQQVNDWEEIKAAERAGQAQGGTLDGVALGLPALLRAQKLQSRLSRVGFDWPDSEGALDKVIEETAELSEARADMDADAAEAEFGDLLFSLVNLARHWGIDAETALRRTNSKVERRFTYVETALARDGKTAREASVNEMEIHWQDSKQEPN